MKLIVLLLLLFQLALFAQKEDSVKAARLDSLRQVYCSGERDLTIMPTARTMPQGTFSFTVYEMIFYHFGLAITPSTQIGLFMPLPVIPKFNRVITLNVKQNVFNSPYFGAALHSSFTFNGGLFTGGGIITVGSGAYNVNASYMYGGKLKEEEWQGLLSIGARVKVKGSFSFIAEYLSAEDDFWNRHPSGKPDGFISLGGRIVVEIAYIDLTLITPSKEFWEGDSTVFPMLKFGLYL